MRSEDKQYGTRPLPAPFLWIIIFAVFLFSEDASAQLREIDPAKLPQDQQVRTAYSKVRSIESMVHVWTPKWAYATPKEEIASLLASSLRDLRSATNAAPQNEELWLLTGLVAHLAYNVDVGKTDEVVLASLETARKLAPSDYRAQWFLASQFCQTNRLKSGMELMLAVENKNSWENLPVGFWDDYIDCSTQSVMPAHTLRAIDHAAHLGESSANYSLFVDIANKRYKPTDANTTYPAREAWQATEEAGKVQFTSQLCGTGFTAESDWHMDIRDVAEGTCISMMETHFYPSKSGKSSPTLVVLSRSPKPQEQLDDFVHSLVKKYPSARPITAPSCPSDKCLAFEILTDTMYQSDGGGHLLVVGFAEESPAFPGLEFEKPDEPPKSKSGEKVAYYHPNERLHRLPGTIYTAVQLDSNDAIFEKASADFRELLKSIRLD